MPYPSHSNKIEGWLLNLFIWRRKKLEKVLLRDYSRLHRLAWSWCHNRHAADELVQETCLRAIDRVEQLKDERKTSQWLIRIMANLYRDRIRGQRANIDLESISLVSPDSAETLANRDDKISQIRNAVSMLNEDQRMVLTLVDLMEFSYAQVSESLDIPIGTVMSRLTRARSNLKNALLNSEGKRAEQPNIRRIK